MLLIYLAASVVIFIVYVIWRQTYWQRKGVPCLKGNFFTKAITKQIGLFDLDLQIYKKLQQMKLKHAGVYFFWKAIYVPIDLALIKNLLLKDFSYFTDRGTYHHPKDILTMNIFNLEGSQWKELKAKLAATFTPGKMKVMYESFLAKADILVNVMESYAANHEGCPIKDVLARFVTDVIASGAFGIECNSLKEPDNVLRKYGKKAIEPKSAWFWLPVIVPWRFLGNLGLKRLGHDVSDYFTNIFKQAIKTREANNIVRKDFVHLLLQLRSRGTVLSENDMVAECFIFFFAGLNNTSIPLSFALLELAQNPDIQEKLRREIDSVFARHGGKLTYDANMEMGYLEQVIYETLRKYPPVTSLERVCTRTYRVPNSDVVIEKGTALHIPIRGIHMDPQYYPDPKKFDPYRFSEEGKQTRPDFTFLPFGEGPRMCLGLRFGMLLSKVALVALIKNFKFTLSKKTQLPIQMDKKYFTLTVKGDIWLDATRI